MRLSSFDDIDEHGQYRPVHGDWEDRDREADLEDRGRFRVRPLLRCPTCFKDLAARKDCAACGDETDVAA
jgi:hypothetical protein